MIIPGNKVRVVEDIATVDGMLRKDTVVRVDEINKDAIRVSDPLGKLWWLNPRKVEKIK